MYMYDQMFGTRFNDHDYIYYMQTPENRSIEAVNNRIVF